MQNSLTASQISSCAFRRRIFIHAAHFQRAGSLTFFMSVTSQTGFSSSPFGVPISLPQLEFWGELRQRDVHPLHRTARVSMRAPISGETSTDFHVIFAVRVDFLVKLRHLCLSTNFVRCEPFTDSSLLSSF